MQKEKLPCNDHYKLILAIILIQYNHSVVQYKKGLLAIAKAEEHKLYKVLCKLSKQTGKWHKK